MVTKQSVDSVFQPRLEQITLGKPVVRSTELDGELAEELLQCGNDLAEFETVIGNTMCTLDFYEGINIFTLYNCKVSFFFAWLVFAAFECSVLVKVKLGWMGLSAHTAKKINSAILPKPMPLEFVTLRWSHRCLRPCAN